MSTSPTTSGGTTPGAGGTTSAAKAEILARIASAVAAHPAVPAAVPREYRHAADAAPGDPTLIDLLVDRLEDYKATVHRCPPDRLAGTVSAALTACGAQRVVVPDGLDLGWLTGWAGAALPDSPTDPLDVATLDGLDGVVTACAVAVAETGTIVLDGSGGCGRRAITLVPDYHLVVVHADQVVGSVPESLTRLEPTRPLTLISGPSATSDIELNRVEGVHGPRTLVVVLVT
jgi:L-lactate dehydrogenase complex protein LldG